MFSPVLHVPEVTGISKERKDQLILDAISRSFYGSWILITPPFFIANKSENVKRIRSNSEFFSFDPLG